jgi:DNA-binding transcriptional MerR regulator
METTKEVASLLGISPAALRAHLSAGNVPQPQRRAGLMFLWTREEIEAARLALGVPGRRRPRYMAEALGEAHND